MRCFTSIRIKAAFITASPVAVLERLIPLCQLSASRGRCNLYWGLILNVLSCTDVHCSVDIKEKLLKIKSWESCSWEHRTSILICSPSRSRTCSDLRWWRGECRQGPCRAGPPCPQSMLLSNTFLTLWCFFFSSFFLFLFFFQALARGNNLFSFYSSNWNRGDCTHQLRLQDQAPGFVKPHVVDLCW